MPITRDERIRVVAMAIMAKRYPHLSHEDHVQLVANRLDEASAALDTADATRRPCGCVECRNEHIRVMREGHE